MRERVNDRVDDGSRRTDRAEFAAAFHPKRLVGARRAQCLDVHRRNVVGARHTIIHERSGQKLTGYFIIDARFTECLTDTLDESTMDLPLDDHWIDHRADVIDRNIVDERYRTCVRVDFDLGDMGTARECEVYRIIERLFLESGFEDIQRVVGREMS